MTGSRSPGMHHPRIVRLFTLNLLMGSALLAAAQAPAPHATPRQGLVDLLLEYLDARYPDRPRGSDLLYASVKRQRLFHIRDGRLLAEYPIATSSIGVGSEQDSYRTPTGLHRVAEKHGTDVPLLGILKERAFTGQLADPDFSGVDKDWITTRVLWLEGLEPGVNRGPGVDSYERCIYIHGTANERSVGTPSSLGCIRMRNADVMALFDAVAIGTLVVILDN